MCCPACTVCAAQQPGSGSRYYLLLCGPRLVAQTIKLQGGRTCATLRVVGAPPSMNWLATGMQEGKLVVVTASNPPEDLLQVADTGLAGMDYLWALALDAPDPIASTVRCCPLLSTH